jgi:signal transduction histidine kinase
LARASALLSESLEMRETSQSLASLCVPFLADWVTVSLLEDGELRRVAGAHAELAKQPLVDAYVAGFPPSEHRSDSPLVAVYQGRTLLFPEVDEALLRRASQNAEHEQLLRAIGCTSSMLVPMRARGRLVGVLSFMRSGGVAYGDADVTLAEALGVRAALAIDNALLLAAERKARVELEAALRSRDEFISIAAHELKTPLTTLALQIAGLLRQLALYQAVEPEKLVRRLERADLQVERLQVLIAQLLDVTRLNERKMRMELAEIDLRALVLEIADRFQDLAMAQGQPLALHLPNAVYLRCDRIRLDQVLSNLLSNALKFGGGKPVTVRVVDGEREVRIEVADQGLGIAAEDHRRIFERFERAASANYGGFGIGLWLARQVVELHGGVLSVESALGRGATFTVRLPRR